VHEQVRSLEASFPSKETTLKPTKTHRLSRMFSTRSITPLPTPIESHRAHGSDRSPDLSKLVLRAQNQVQEHFESLENLIGEYRKILHEERQWGETDAPFQTPSKDASTRNREVVQAGMDTASAHSEVLTWGHDEVGSSSKFQGDQLASSTSARAAEILPELFVRSTADGLERFRRELRNGHGGLTVVPGLDKALQWCQTSCQQALYHFRRGRSCSAEIADIWKRLVQLKALVKLMASWGEVEPTSGHGWNDQSLTSSISIENMLDSPEKVFEEDSYDPVTSDPYDIKNYTRIANILDRLCHLYDQGVHRSVKEVSTKLEESLRTFFRLRENVHLTVYRWEAPKVFREWYGTAETCDQLNNAEKLVAFQKTLVILGSDPYFETKTLADYISQKCGSTGKMVLELVTEALMYAIERDQENNVPFNLSQTFETTYVWSKESDEETAYQLLLMEGYIILGCESQHSSSREPWDSILYICQALRCQPTEKSVSNEFEDSIAAFMHTEFSKAVRLVHVSESLVCMAAQRWFQAFTISALRPRVCAQETSCWIDLFKPSAIVIHSKVDGEPKEGLQIPFDLMVHLAAVETATLVYGRGETTELEDLRTTDHMTATNNSTITGNGGPAVKSSAQSAGIVLSGFFTALIPIEDDQEHIGWHLEYIDPSKTDSELALIDPYNLCCTEGDWFKTTEYDFLRRKKCILGWWNEANILLGTQELRSNVRFSKPSATKSQSLHLNEISALGQIGASTVVPLSVQGGAVFKFVNNVQHFGRENMYTMALMKMANDIALVYDAEADRGWLVPQLSLILHMSHTYFNTVLGGDTSLDPIPYAEPSPDGATAALKVLQEKGGTILYHGDSDGNILLSTVLATLHANICESNKTREPSKPGKLLAAQYLSMVEEPTVGSNITITKTPLSMKAWYGLIDRVGCVMVCAGLGEAIKPVVIDGECTEGCNKLACGKGYLGAHFWCLKKLLERCGWDLGDLGEKSVSINDDQTWALRGDMFYSCMIEEEHLCRWESRNIQLQQVVKERWKLRTIPCEKRPAPHVTGAAVFGIP
jgi:hypothetical protein